MSNKIHIVSFSIPYPADYGGVIDVFYKIKALYLKGFEITLHCFQYNRSESAELEKYCVSVIYYPRRSAVKSVFNFLPYIVSSRKSNALVENLLKDDAPILFEGIHTCISILDNRLKGRLKIVRSHNIEHDYYANLAAIEKNKMKKFYFSTEARRLKKFEEIAYNKADYVLAISTNDQKYLSEKYGSEKVIHVSAFHAFENVNVSQEIGDFAFYHGNLGVGENNQAALFLVKEVFSKVDYPLVIAGNNPSKELIDSTNEFSNITLKSGISSDAINDLIKSAQMNVLPTFQSTGIKLKLLASLFVGKHCVVNEAMVSGSGLESTCVLADNAQEFAEKISQLKSEPISEAQISYRKSVLKNYTNAIHAQKIVELLQN